MWQGIPYIMTSTNDGSNTYKCPFTEIPKYLTVIRFTRVHFYVQQLATLWVQTLLFLSAAVQFL